LTNRHEERLNDTYYRVFLIDSIVSRDPDGGYQIASGFAYLEPGVPTLVELLDSTGEVVGDISFPDAVVRRIKLALVAVNTIFKFYPKENNK